MAKLRIVTCALLACGCSGGFDAIDSAGEGDPAPPESASTAPIAEARVEVCDRDVDCASREPCVVLARCDPADSSSDARGCVREWATNGALCAEEPVRFCRVWAGEGTRCSP